MFLIVCFSQLTAPAQCNLPDYPRILNINDTALGYIISERGVHKFIADGMEYAVTFLQKMSIPDADYPINLGLIQIKFQIKDIIFETLTVGSVEAQLTGSPNVTAALKGMHATIKFAWAFQEQQAPYLSDSGTGLIIVDGMDLQITIETSIDPDCPGHLKIIIHRATIGVETLKLQLDGGNSFIYQSMINLIMESLTDKLVAMLQDVMVSVIQDMMDNYIANSGYFQEYIQVPGIYTDDRFTSPIEVGYKYLAIRFSGYTYYWDNKSDEFVNPSMLAQGVPFNYLNSIYQFLIYQAGFQNNLYIMHKYKKAFDVKNMFTNTEMPRIQIQGNGVLLTFTGVSNGTELEINMKGTYNQHTDVQPDEDLDVRNVTYIYFDLTYLNHTIKGQATPEFNLSKLIQNLPSQLTELYKIYGYMINNTPFMELKKFLPVYDQDWQVIRIFYPESMLESENKGSGKKKK